VSEKILPGTVICRLPACEEEKFVKFSEPLSVFEAWEPKDVIRVLDAVENATKEGQYAAGYITYEASSAFDDSYSVFSCSDSPLIWFGIYDKYENFIIDGKEQFKKRDFDLESEISETDYLNIIESIKKHIENGDIYQANFTYRLNCPVELPLNDDYLKLFIYILEHHPVPYGAFVDTGKNKILSFSPELFIEKKGKRIVSRPMKGTAPRGLSSERDYQYKKDLHFDEKNRAENLMIVDMVRNDLGRICNIGSVKVERLFEVQSFFTVHQMISEISGILPEEISIADIFKSLFPAASITGAPKIMAMYLINKYELSPRKVYTGSIGCVLPCGDLCFNIAIRTLIVNNGSGELGIGSGIVADSVHEEEWQECILKSKFLKPHSRNMDFKLLETILWEPEKGFKYLDEHLNRICGSARRFGWKCSKEQFLESLNEKISALGDDVREYMRVRLLFSPVEGISSEFIKIESPGWVNKSYVKITLSDKKTSSNNIFLYHKTTNRCLYNTSFKHSLSQGWDEVIFRNEKNEITEGAISNIFIRKEGKWFTPPIECGLLPGIWRSKIIQQLNAECKILYISDLIEADEILVGNSVRGEGKGILFI